VVGAQLFSEPGAGSDLAGLQTRAVADGDEWIVNGQKVWTSGAHYSDIGEIICRTDPDQPKHRGLTGFVVDMRAPGVEIRPLRQMTGGASFNEVFFTDVRLDDDPLTRGELARLYESMQVAKWNNQRAMDKVKAGQAPGPELSIAKMALTRNMQMTGEFVAKVLGPRMVADTGEWGTYAWNKFVVGTPGMRVAGGTDEVLRNIVSERVLGLPKEPGIDTTSPFKELAQN
jgi:acyl-CoA dehydrogenase